MKIQISEPFMVGPAVRATRRSLALRQDDAAGTIGVSENFLSKVERGGDAVQWNKLFQVMQQLGIKVSVEIPDSASELFSLELEKVLQKRPL
jgi:transcriptional regulator with XRE-family HTH domain